MQILIDTANVPVIQKLFEYYPIDGVTTNPTIIAAEKGNFLEILQSIRTIIGVHKAIHVQSLGIISKDIVEEAEYLNQKLRGNLYIKIPVTQEGIKAIKMLKDKGIKTTATAILTPQQALIAAKAGAEYVIPYINRLDNICSDGVRVVSEIVQIFEMHGIHSKVIGASFKNVEQVHKCCLVGANAVTVNADILKQMLYHPLTDLSVEQFVKDWEELYGAGKKTFDV
jgi:fructose-6-phosphate aldolase 2